VIPVVVYPTHQAKKALALAEYCRELDGTVLHLIEQTPEDDARCEIAYPWNRFHCLQSHSLRRASREIGTEFIWLESDSIPLKPRWVRTLTEEYWKAKEQGKRFLVSSDSQKFDLISGIGCYPAETQYLVPVDYKKSGWDLWLIEIVPDLVARTPLIMHSYCKYGPDGFCKEEHRIPRDMAMIRPDALIFHRDPHQDLIPQ
jgi:hypothetical protein